jgi:phospholipid transport system transporter-binding protein
VTGRLEAAGSRDGTALFRISGVLDFDSVPGIFRESLKQFGEQGDIDLDLADVERANSAGLALLLEWRRLAQAAGRSITVRNTPAALRNLARISELETLLSL